jgi:hypothetical protein
MNARDEIAVFRTAAAAAAAAAAACSSKVSRAVTSTADAAASPTEQIFGLLPVQLQSLHLNQIY